MRSIYTYLVTRLILALARLCLRRGRYVDYTHAGRHYMRRYAILGHLTGDGQRGIRTWFPNLYLHQIIAPDLDPAVHDHPWPWAVSWIMLGGYREERAGFCTGPRPSMPVYYSVRSRTAPAINRLDGSTYHRIAKLDRVRICEGKAFTGRPCLCTWSCPTDGTWTLFLAGPRRKAKTWGYLVPGRGYVTHAERHREIDGKEYRGKPCQI